MKGTRIYARGAQMEALIEALNGDAAEHPVRSIFVTGEQMERLIAVAGGDPPTNPVRSKYATGEQMERLIAAYGGDAPTNPVHSKYATNEQMERLIAAVGGDPAEYPVPSKYITADQMARLVDALEGGTDPLSVISGEIASWTSSRSKPFEGLVVDIDPVQDLHGYSNPWPAGGGKNLFNKDAATVGKWLNVSTGAIENTTTNYALSDWIPVKSGLPYVYTNPSSSRRWFYDSSKQPVEQISTNPYTPASDGYVLITVAVFEVSLDTFQVEQASTLGTYSPYSNICPISGHTGTTVTRTGINIWDGEWAYGDISDSTGANDGTSTSRFRSKNYIPVKPGMAFYLLNAGRSSNFRLFFYDKDKSYLGYTSKAWNSTFTINSATLTYWDKVAFMRWRVSGTHADSDLLISFNVPSSDTAFHTYAGVTIPIDWTDEAGTVYGGTLDVLTGTLTVTHAAVTYSGDDGWSSGTVSGYSVFQIRRGSIVPTARAFISNYIKHVQSITGSTDNCGYYGSTYFNVRCSALTLDEWKAMLNSTPMICVYDLVTPVEYTLDPETIDTLVGLNNVWADTGDVEVTVYGTPIVEPDADALTSLNILLGNAYTRSGDDPTDEEALNIILGGDTR